MRIVIFFLLYCNMSVQGQSVTEDLFGDEEEQSPPQKKEERMEVTGSHIKRVEVEGASPIQTLDSEDLEKSGHNSVADVLRDLASNSFGSQREKSGNNAAGVAHVSLRGLGSARTLVLLNGKRLARDGVTSSPDLNLISMAAIDRVDILKDSSSATYGSDAVGGVVNIITKKDFTGADLRIRREVAELPGGDKTTLSGTVGLAGTHSNALVAFQYRDNSVIYARDRQWSKTGVSYNTPVPNVDTGSGPLGLSGEGLRSCPQDRIDRRNERGLCTYNYADHATSLPGIEQFNLMFLGHHQLNYVTELSLQARGTRKRTDWIYAPGSLRMDLQSDFIDSLGLPGHTPGELVNARWRSEPFGNRISQVETDAVGVSLAAKRFVGESWEVEAALGSERIRRNDRSPSGYIKKAELIAAVESGACDIFRLGGQCPVADSVHYEPWELVRSRLDAFDLRASGELFDTSAGPVFMAVGGQLTYEMFSDDLDALTLAGGVLGSSGSQGGGERRVSALFSEFAVPVLPNLEIQLAGRYDRYSDFGDSFNPKLAAVYRPVKELLFRASAGTGFKAPDMTELYASQSEGYPTFIDAVACKRAWDALSEEDKKNPQKNPLECEPRQYLAQFGGNEGLSEEKSRTFNIGAFYQPTESFGLGFDIFDIRLENMVGLSYNGITRAELNGVDLSRYNTTVERNSIGNIVKITTQVQNLSESHVRGIDFNLGLRRHFAGIGELALTSETSYLLVYRLQNFPGLGFGSVLGNNGSPRWRNNLNIEYGPRDDLRFVASLNTIGAHAKADSSQGKLSAYTSVDLQASYAHKRWGRVTLGARNAFGTTAPLDNSNVNNQLDETLYDNIGRRFFLAYGRTF